MQTVLLPAIGTVAAWRAQARALVQAGVPGENLLWQVGGQPGDLFASRPAPGSVPVPGASAPPLRLTRPALAGIETALHHRDPERFARAYDVVLRLTRGTLRWGDRSDAALCKLLAQAKAVRRDIHKMHAFVRFREVGAPDAPRRAFAAWFEPDHPILEPASGFFARRFGDMDWVIATPGLSARFEAGRLSFAQTTTTRTPPPADATEDLWRTYFAHIFNPARLMVSAMTSEMPRKYWKNLPEADVIPDLIRTAPARARAMEAAMPTMPHSRAAKLRAMCDPGRPAPAPETVQGLKPALDACRRCPLGACATQAVAGAGAPGAWLMAVAEQPDDLADLLGQPFAGPPGRLFDACVTRAGLERAQIYVTYALKHFKFASHAKARLGQAPSDGELAACRGWLDRECAALRPRVVLAMGAVAARALREYGGTGDGAVVIDAPALADLGHSEARARERACAALVAALSRAGRVGADRP